MARKQFRLIDVTGMSINDLMNIDLQVFNALGESDLRAITSRLVSASNKRIRYLKEHDIQSPALRSLGTQDVFSTQLPKDVSPKQRVNKLRSEFARARNFLLMKTSTIKGYRNYQRQIRSGLETEIGRKLTDNEISTAFRILHKLQEDGKVAGLHSAGSQHAKEQIFQLLNDLDNFDLETMEDDPTSYDDYLMNATKKEYKKYYESKPEEQFTIISDKR